MDNFEMTKIAGAVLAALLLIFGTKVFIEERSEKGEDKAGYALPGTAKPAADAKAVPAAKTDGAAPAELKTAEAPKDAAAAPAKPDAAPAAGGSAGAETVALLSKASAENGKSIFGKCKACHAAEKGKVSPVGPSLYGVVNRARGTLEGFNYSEGMKTKGGTWTFEELGNFLNNPKGYVQGTKMVFNGLPTAADRADIIAYLAAQADTPVELPK
jgi:cytochrome c